MWEHFAASPLRADLCKKVSENSKSNWSDVGVASSSRKPGQRKLSICGRGVFGIWTFAA